jgi:hypothetical protein
MPLLSAVAATYIATDTHIETKVEIPQNSPMIVAVRENAIKSLEAKAERAPTAAPSPPPANATAPPEPPPGTTSNTPSGGTSASAGTAPVTVSR